MLPFTGLNGCLIAWHRSSHIQFGNPGLTKPVVLWPRTLHLSRNIFNCSCKPDSDDSYGGTKLVPERFHIIVDIFLCQQGARMVPSRCQGGALKEAIWCQQGAKGDVVSLCHYSANIEDVWCHYMHHYSVKCVEEVWCQEGGNGMWCQSLVPSRCQCHARIKEWHRPGQWYFGAWHLNGLWTAPNISHWDVLYKYDTSFNKVFPCFHPSLIWF